jgi:hypothetical protein
MIGLPVYMRFKYHFDLKETESCDSPTTYVPFGPGGSVTPFGREAFRTPAHWTSTSTARHARARKIGVDAIAIPVQHDGKFGIHCSCIYGTRFESAGEVLHLGVGGPERRRLAGSSCCVF